MTFRFRPRFGAFAFLVGALGLVVLAGAPFVQGSSRTFALTCGVIGPALAAAYLASPAWRLRVRVDPEALAVVRGGRLCFCVPWLEVKRVLAAPSTKTCFVDGGTAAHSLLVPGPGAPGPYRIEGREALYDFILAHVPSDRVVVVPSIEEAGEVLARKGDSA